MQNSSIRTKKTFADRVDDFIGVFSPETAAKRKYFRFLTRSLLGSYRGADVGRLRGSWIPGGGSADSDLHPDLTRLRERSRDLIRNDGIASGAIDTVITNIIGSGIRMQSRIDKDTLAVNEDVADKLQKQIEKVWERWVPFADAGQRLSVYGLEELSERQRFINGESIIVPLRVFDSKKRRPYSLVLQTIESDRLDTPSDLMFNKNIRAGVEVGEYGEPVSYFVRKNHPGDFLYGRRYSNSSENFIKYPALNGLGDPNIFHLYHVKRSGQTRGEPFFSSVMNMFKDRADYMEAEIVAARVAACFAIFIKKTNSYEVSLARSKSEGNKRVEELSPAMIEYLNENEEIQPFNPNRPGGTFGIFMERILRDISAGLNIPYEILAKDFSRSNYSNTRAALLEARRFFMMQQRFIAENLCQHILVMLLEEAYLKGELPILDFYQNRDAYVRTRWIAPGWQWVDPEN
ncbi:MAG: phage portal protein, partial [Candidatus Omnitrophica bacterium]|nr:phage portal protein [Candidatus Omnitrophota bacterium]